MTRKPWKVDYDGPSLPIITSSDPERFVVALVRTDEEDANLMAAAYELLEALKTMERLIVELYPGDLEPDLEHVDEYKAVWNAVMDARAAIAKAEKKS